MRRTRALGVLLLFLSQAAFAQSLVGTWVSNQLLLSLVRFSLTFRSDMTYEIDTTLGKTTGTYTFTGNTIIFTPVNVGINGGSVGAVDVYPYRFSGENTLSLVENGTEVTFLRTQF